MADYGDSIKDLAEVFTQRAMELGCDSIQVFATFIDSGSTGSLATGRGNLYARQGRAKQWLEAQSEIERDHWREKPLSDSQ